MIVSKYPLIGGETCFSLTKLLEIRI